MSSDLSLSDPLHADMTGVAITKANRTIACADLCRINVRTSRRAHRSYRSESGFYDT